MSAHIREKRHESTIKSAFLKGNTLIHLIKIRSIEPPVSGVPNNDVLKIKLEIDTDPPAQAGYEQKYRLQPEPYGVLLYDIPSIVLRQTACSTLQKLENQSKGARFL